VAFRLLLTIVRESIAAMRAEWLAGVKVGISMEPKTNSQETGTAAIGMKRTKKSEQSK
jgi:hypothetical protein